MTQRVLLAVFLLIFAATAHGQSFDSLVQRADSLYDQFEGKEALQLYEQVLEQDSTHYRALWRASFLYSRIGNRFEDKDLKREYFNRALDLAKRALRVDSTDVYSNFVMGVAKGRKALVSGARDRVAASKDIRKYAQRAVRYDSTHAGSWHLLGRWHYEVSNLGFGERLAANLLFGGAPKGASMDKAIEYLERAVRLNPRYVIYHHDLAEAYREAGMERKAVEACRSALEKKTLTHDDPGLKEECRRMVEELDNN